MLPPRRKKQRRRNRFEALQRSRKGSDHTEGAEQQKIRVDRRAGKVKKTLPSDFEEVKGVDGGTGRGSVAGEDRGDGVACGGMQIGVDRRSFHNTYLKGFVKKILKKNMNDKWCGLPCNRPFVDLAYNETNFLEDVNLITSDEDELLRECVFQLAAKVNEVVEEYSDVSSLEAKDLVFINKFTPTPSHQGTRYGRWSGVLVNVDLYRFKGRCENMDDDLKKRSTSVRCQCLANSSFEPPPDRKKKFRKNDFFFKNFAYVKKKIAHMHILSFCFKNAQIPEICLKFFYRSLHNTYLNGFVKNFLKKNATKKLHICKKKKNCTYAKNKKNIVFSEKIFSKL
ncbi:hypothetical protein LXL04_030836 [Taraxacum kok-saghyz]